MSTGTQPTACPRCAKEFQCGIDSGNCWCAGVTLDGAVRAAFAEYYDGCLCEDCLRSVEQTRPPRPSVRAFLAGQLRRKLRA